MQGRPAIPIHDMSIYRALRPLLFQMEPELAHNCGLWAIENGLVSTKLNVDRSLRREFFGTEFPNPLGLAAGFDKNAAAASHWHQLGFGFVEFGTVTLHEQPGNPKPRLFRLPEHQAIVNRMGFNNSGARAMAIQLSRSSIRIPYGINIGKSKISPLTDAADEYAEIFRILGDFGTYFVINVSSPNTPALRELQDKAALIDIVQAMQDVRRDRPILIKVAPDLSWAALDEVVQVVNDYNLSGLVATNTSIKREELGVPFAEAGGLSGKPIQELAQSFTEHLGKLKQKNQVLIGVGGIHDGDSLKRRFDAGADLCQIYTSWVFGGPEVVPELLTSLVNH